MAAEINKQLGNRMLNFSVEIIKLCQQAKTSIPFSVADQIIRSSSSIGANFVEANDAVSRADLKNKIGIAKKEAAETRYWLKLMAQLGINVPENLFNENNELILILQKIINTLKNGKVEK